MSNFGPPAFQSNAFQSHPIAFQMDPDVEAPVEAGSWVAQAPPVTNLVAEAAKVNIWIPEDEPNPTP